MAELEGVVQDLLSKAFRAKTVEASVFSELPSLWLLWQDAFTSAFVSGHGQKRYREASIDHSATYGQYANSNKRRG